MKLLKNKNFSHILGIYKYTRKLLVEFFINLKKYKLKCSNLLDKFRCCIFITIYNKLAKRAQKTSYSLPRNINSPQVYL